MLSTSQVRRFHESGYIVLRNVFDTTTTAALGAEVGQALRDAYGERLDERVEDGISGHYLPMASHRTPLSAQLVCDDPRLIDTAQQLLGDDAVPECPEGVLYFTEGAWHTDDGIRVRAVKFATYFDTLRATRGALRLIPGSHRAGPGGCTNPGAREEAEVLAVVETRPGDVVAFDVHIRHASTGGRDRLASTITYQRCPHTEFERQLCHRSMVDGFEQAFRGFDRERYPIWRDWLADGDGSPDRAVVTERMRAAGLLDLSGAQVGW